jgi:hypothetical protein
VRTTLSAVVAGGGIMAGVDGYFMDYPPIGVAARDAFRR